MTLGPQGVIGGHCSCPIGEGGHCKHAAALLLTWLNDPEEVAEVAALDEMLEPYSKAELVALIREMVRRDPSLESWWPREAIDIYYTLAQKGIDMRSRGNYARAAVYLRHNRRLRALREELDKAGL